MRTNFHINFACFTLFYSFLLVSDFSFYFWFSSVCYLHVVHLYFSWIFLLRMNSGNHHLNQFEEYNPVVFNIFTMLYNHHHYLWNIFITSNRNSITINQELPIPSFSQPLVTTVYFPFIWICMESYNSCLFVCDLLCLAHCLHGSPIQIIACVRPSFLFRMNLSIVYL